METFISPAATRHVNWASARGVGELAHPGNHLLSLLDYAVSILAQWRAIGDLKGVLSANYTVKFRPELHALGGVAKERKKFTVAKDRNIRARSR